jgi:tetratricopeptide (TPR) repeat protein
LALAISSVLWSGAFSALASEAAEEAIKKAIQNGQLDRAQKLVQKELKNAPQSVQWRFMEGVIQAQQGQVDKAIDTFKKITQSHPEQSESYNNLGVLYAAKGQLEDSKAFLEKALQTHPSYAAAHRNLSDVHSHLAKQSYAKALQVDPRVKASAPQLTLLGSMGSQRRALSVNVAAASHAPPAHAQTISPDQVLAESPQALPAATPPADKITPHIRPQDRTDIEQAVQAWAKAWSDKDMARYYAAYADNFVPAKRASRTQWENDRRQRIVSKQTISVQVRDPKINIDGDKAQVRFTQLYDSDNLKNTSRKTLDMVRLDTQWLIVRESVN